MFIKPERGIIIVAASIPLFEKTVHMPRSTLNSTDEPVLTRLDIENSVGCVPIPSEERTGIIYHSGEEFLNALKERFNDPVEL